MRRHHRDVVEGQPGRCQSLAHRLEQHRRAPFASSRQGSCRRQGLRQSPRLGPLGRVQVSVARAAGQTIGLTHRGAGLDRHRQAQVDHDPAQHQQLLPILFAQKQPIGFDHGQQPGHHRGYPLEVPGPRDPTQGSGEAGRRHQLGEGVGAFGVNIVDAGRP